MTTADVLAALDAVIEATPPDGRATLVIQLSARIAALAAGMASEPASMNGHCAPEEDRLLDMPSVAGYLDIPEDRARDLGRCGKLPVVTIGKYKRVRLSALVAYVQAHENRGLDRAVSGILSLRHDGRRGKAAAEAIRAHAGRVRQTGRHASRHGLEVGDGCVGGRPAVVAAHGTAGEDAAAEAKE